MDFENSERTNGKSPSVEDLEIFCKICSRIALGDSFNAAVSKVAPKRSAPGIWYVISKLEKYYDLIIFNRKSKSNILLLTRQGRTLFEHTKELLQFHGEFFLARKKSQLTIGTSNAILLHTLPSVVSAYVENLDVGVNLNFMEDDYPGLTAGVISGKFDFALGPMLHKLAYPTLELFPIISDLEFVLIFNPRHKFSKKLDANEPIYLSELASERLFVLQEHKQPGLLENLEAPAPGEGGSRVEVSHYSSIQSFCEMGLGVGIVPGWYPLLDELRKRCILFSVPLKELGGISLAAYLPRGGRKSLSSEAQAFLEAAIKSIRQIQTESAWKDARQSFNIKEHLQKHPIDQYKYTYHVTSEKLGYRPARWSKGRLKVQEVNNKITGHQLDDDGSEFEIEGVAYDRLLSLVGTRVSNGGISEVYVNAFNCIGERNTLVGTWTGEDRTHEAPLSAQIILSKQSDLSDRDLNSISTWASTRFISMR